MQQAKTALLVMVHGSPKQSANNPMVSVVDEVRSQGVFDFVQVGYMECNDPTIPDAIELCVAQGVSRMVAVPYFLHRGTHVAFDLPQILNEARLRFPHVEFALGPYIGLSDALTDLLLDRALEAA
jgi:sirohydrochlorin ferrochelatase